MIHEVVEVRTAACTGTDVNVVTRAKWVTRLV